MTAAQSVAQLKHGTPHHVLARAALALKSRHARFEHAAQQKLPELARDELRRACAVAARDALAAHAPARYRQPIARHAVPRRTRWMA